MKKKNHLLGVTIVYSKDKRVITRRAIAPRGLVRSRSYAITASSYRRIKRLIQRGMLIFCDIHDEDGVPPCEIYEHRGVD